MWYSASRTQENKSSKTLHSAICIQLSSSFKQLVLDPLLNIYYLMIVLSQHYYNKIILPGNLNAQNNVFLLIVNERRNVVIITRTEYLRQFVSRRVVVGGGDFQRCQ